MPLSKTAALANLPADSAARSRVGQASHTRAPGLAQHNFANIISSSESAALGRSATPVTWQSPVSPEGVVKRRRFGLDSAQCFNLVTVEPLFICRLHFGQLRCHRLRLHQNQDEMRYLQRSMVAYTSNDQGACHAKAIMTQQVYLLARHSMILSIVRRGGRPRHSHTENTVWKPAFDGFPGAGLAARHAILPDFDFARLRFFEVLQQCVLHLCPDRLNSGLVVVVLVHVDSKTSHLRHGQIRARHGFLRPRSHKRLVFKQPGLASGDRWRRRRLRR